MFKPNYFDSAVAITVRVEPGAGWDDSAGTDRYKAAQDIINQNSGTIHGFINGQAQLARGKAFWAHEYETEQWSARFSSNSGQMLCILTIRPANAQPTGTTITSGGTYVLDVPFTTFPLLGQGLRDNGDGFGDDFIVSSFPVPITPQADITNVYVVPGSDQSNYFKYYPSQGAYAYDPLFVDENVAEGAANLTMGVGTPLAYMTLNGPYKDFIAAYQTAVCYSSQYHLGFEAGADPSWGLKHVGASAICPQPLVGLAYFEVEITKLATPNQPTSHTAAYEANQECGTYIKTGDVEMSAKSYTIKFPISDYPYLTPAIGVVPEGFINSDWKKPLTVWGRILGLDTDPTKARSIGVVRTMNQFVDLQAKYFFPGSYWMTGMATYETARDVGTWETIIVEYDIHGVETGRSDNTIHIQDVTNYTAQWVPPEDETGKAIRINCALMAFDRNPALVNPGWLLTSFGVGGKYDIQFSVAYTLAPYITYLPHSNIGMGAYMCAPGLFNGVGEDFTPIRSNGTSSIGVDGQYVIDAPNGYIDIPITGPGAGAVSQAIVDGMADAGNLLLDGTTTATSYYYETGIPETVGTVIVAGAHGSPHAGSIRYMKLDSYWPAGNKYVTDASIAAIRPGTWEGNHDYIWKYIGQVGGPPSGRYAMLDGNGAMQAVAGSIHYIAQQYVSTNAQKVAFIGDVFGGAGTTYSLGSFSGFGDITYEKPSPPATITQSKFDALGVDEEGHHSWVFKGRADMLTNPLEGATDAPLPYGVWSGVDLGDFVEKDVIMVAVDTSKRKIWFGKNGKWYDKTGETRYAPGSKELDPALLLDGTAQTTKYFPACSARVGHTVLTMLFGASTKYLPPTGFTPYNLVTINIP